jgi:hypothetical protein
LRMGTAQSGRTCYWVPSLSFCTVPVPSPTALAVLRMPALGLFHLLYRQRLAWVLRACVPSRYTLRPGWGVPVSRNFISHSSSVQGAAWRARPRGPFIRPARYALSMAMDPNENQCAAAGTALRWRAIGHGPWPSVVVTVQANPRFTVGCGSDRWT